MRSHTQALIQQLLTCGREGDHHVALRVWHRIHLHVGTLLTDLSCAGLAVVRDGEGGAGSVNQAAGHVSACEVPRRPTCSRPHGRALRPRWHRRSPRRAGAVGRSCATTRTTTGVDATKSASGRRSRMPENGKTVTRALGHWRLPPRRVPRATTLFREKWRVYMSRGRGRSKSVVGTQRCFQSVTVVHEWRDCQHWGRKVLERFVSSDCFRFEFDRPTSESQKLLLSIENRFISLHN